MLPQLVWELRNSYLRMHTMTTYKMMIIATLCCFQDKNHRKVVMEQEADLIKHNILCFQSIAMLNNPKTSID